MGPKNTFFTTGKTFLGENHWVADILKALFGHASAIVFYLLATFELSARNIGGLSDLRTLYLAAYFPEMAAWQHLPCI